MKITNVRVYGFEENIVASSYPMKAKLGNEQDFEQLVNEVKSDMQKAIDNPDYNIFAESKHFKRAKHLATAKAGSGHDCFLKGIVVQCDINAPQYFWQQWQRYHFCDIISSQSKMHCINKMGIEETVMNETIYMAREVAKDAISEYDGGEIGIDECLANIPMGLEYTARTTMNYLQLKSMYHQRRTHRSKQWQVFCDWIERLPYAKEFIVGNK